MPTKPAPNTFSSTLPTKIRARSLLLRPSQNNPRPAPPERGFSFPPILLSPFRSPPPHLPGYSVSKTAILLTEFSFPGRLVSKTAILLTEFPSLGRLVSKSAILLTEFPSPGRLVSKTAILLTEFYEKMLYCGKVMLWKISEITILARSGISARTVLGNKSFFPATRISSLR